MSKLSAIFSSVLGIPEEKVTPDLSPDTEPAWDSLNAIVLLTEIEHAYDIRFGYDEAMQVHTFADAQKLLASKGKDPYE